MASPPPRRAVDWRFLSISDLQSVVIFFLITILSPQTLSLFLRPLNDFLLSILTSHEIENNLFWFMLRTTLFFSHGLPQLLPSLFPHFGVSVFLLSLLRFPSRQMQRSEFYLSVNIVFSFISPLWGARGVSGLSGESAQDLAQLNQL